MRAEHFRGFQDLRLFDGNGVHQLIVIELGKNRAHAVVAESPAWFLEGMKSLPSGTSWRAGRRGPCRRSHAPKRSGRARFGQLAGSTAMNLVVRSAAELFTHERGMRPPRLTTAGAADDDVRLDAEFRAQRFVSSPMTDCVSHDNSTEPSISGNRWSSPFHGFEMAQLRLPASSLEFGENLAAPRLSSPGWGRSHVKP